jgi:hypothetical protein
VGADLRAATPAILGLIVVSGINDDAAPLEAVALGRTGLVFPLTPGQWRWSILTRDWDPARRVWAYVDGYPPERDGSV